MRTEPTFRIPVGVAGLFLALIIYALVIARYAPSWIGAWPTWLQTIIYLTLGVIWLLPLRRFLIWMETGRWTPPEAPPRQTPKQPPGPPPEPSPKLGENTAGKSPSGASDET